ncbi:MAG: hypothetical protein Q8M39_04980 [Sulfuricurvum sp.]|nr:hypothetical protein [Sulfuricurvum sp.]
MLDWFNPAQWKGLKSNTLFVIGTIIITRGYYVQVDKILFPSENQYISEQKFYVIFAVYTIILLIIFGLFFKFLLVYERDGIKIIKKDEKDANTKGTKIAKVAISKIEGVKP